MCLFLRLFYLLLRLSVLDNEIAPDPISKTNPIVNTIKNIIATEKPKVLTWYKVTPMGINKRISRSKTRNNKPTM